MTNATQAIVCESRDRPAEGGAPIAKWEEAAPPIVGKKIVLLGKLAKLFPSKSGIFCMQDVIER